MTSKSKKMNSEINVKEIFWRFFEQWKAVLLFSVAIALLTTGVKYYLDLKDYARSEDIVSPEDFRGDAEEILESLTDVDRTAVQKLMKEKNLLDVRKDYYDHSLVFHMDPSNCNMLLLLYEIKTEEDNDRATLIDAYNNCLISEEMADSLRDAIGSEADTKYIYELFTYAGYGDTEKEMSARDAKNSLVISVLLPQNADSDEIQNTITRYLAKNKANLTKLIAEHEIRLISNKTVKYPGIELAQEQNGVLNSVTTAQNDFNNHYAMLSEDQRTAYNMVMAIQYPDTFEMPVMERSKPEISKKTFAAGIIFGAFIYGALLGLILLLRRRVISVEDTKYYPGISNLFEFNNYTEKTGLLNSRAVSKFRRKRVPIERQVDSCVEEISLLCSGNKLDKVTILSPGTMAEKCDILIKEVSRKLTAEGIKVSVMELEDTDMVVDKRKLTESSPVIPVIVEDKTKLDGFNSLMNLCNYLNCKVIGTIYYGEK